MRKPCRVTAGAQKAEVEGFRDGAGPALLLLKGKGKRDTEAGDEEERLT